MFRIRVNILVKSMGIAVVYLFSAGLVPAWAAENGTGAHQTVYQLPAVSVTADKRLTEAQKTPIALTVVTEQELEDRNIKTVQDALAQVPNLVTSSWSGGINWTSFRGAMSISGTGASPLIMYVDGVPVDTFYNLDANLMNVERIEILRGPQSAIYGKNALGGVINIISKKPDNHYSGKITTYGESHDGWGIGATASGPLKEDMWYFSLSASHDYSGGWMDSSNTHRSNSQRRDRAKGQLRFTPTDKSEFILHMDYAAVRDGYNAQTFGNRYSDKTTAGPKDKNELDIVNTALTARLDFDRATFESITTFRYEDTLYQMDTGELMRRMGQDGAGMSGDGKKKTELTHEFRLRSPDDQEGFAWLIGAYGSYADTNIDNLYQEYDYYMFPGFGDNSRLDQQFRQYTTELAPFAQIVAPVTDAFKVTAGLRWHSLLSG